MKKLVLISCLVSALIAFSGCDSSGHDSGGDYAIIKMKNGDVIEGYVSSFEETNYGVEIVVNGRTFCAEKGTVIEYSDGSIKWY